MFSNNLYNLMMQVTIEHTSLWRIKKEYMKDAKLSTASKKFWMKMIKDKEEHIKDLKQIIKQELK